MASDLLTRVRREIEARLQELRPRLGEYERLAAAAQALGITTDHTPVSSAGAAERTPGASRARRRGRGLTTSAGKRASSGAAPRTSARQRRGRAPRGAARQAILEALEHRSHTASELASVTATSRPNVYGHLKRLQEEGTITKTEREGSSVYALRSASGARTPATQTDAPA